MARVAFTVYGLPAGQGSMKAIVSKTTGRIFLKHSQKTVEWRRLVAAHAVKALDGGGLLDGALVLRASFYFPRPQSVSEKKRPLPCVQPDYDKLARAIGDALEGVIYRNDAQICKAIIEKQYGVPARVELELVEIP